MKCPECGFVTDWDTLQCPCGYDGERPATVEPSGGSESEVPPERARPRWWVWDYAMGLVWVLVVLGCTVVAIVILFFVFVLSSIGVNDGANRVPGFLLLVTPIGGFVLLVGGIWFIARRPSKPKASEIR